MHIRLPPIEAQKTDGRSTFKLYSDPENGSLLGGIENENVVAVVDLERMIESDRRYSLGELVTDASATSQSMSAPPPPTRSPLLSGRSQALRDISRASRLFRPPKWRCPLSIPPWRPPLNESVVSTDHTLTRQPGPGVLAGCPEPHMPCRTSPKSSRTSRRCPLPAHRRGSHHARTASCR